MALIDHILQEPSYGWANKEGELIVPSARQMFKEAFSRINIFKTKKNWISLMGWFMLSLMLAGLAVYIFNYFSWKIVIVMVIYSMIIMGTHGTIWYHRYCTHGAYKFRNRFWRILTQNLVIKTIPEEMYVVSHHVHHSKSDQPGDPYNARGGLLYCMLADVNHQSISKNLSETDYAKASRFLQHTGNPVNSFKQYSKWGSISNPWHTIAIWLINWTCWYAIFFLIGGHGLALGLFGAAGLWVMLVRAFNYTGHGGGKEKFVDGVDFDRSNLAVNQTRPGLFTGEWHNNHHLYPGSARAGFLPNQFDLAWIFIYGMYKLGAVTSYHDSKKEFLKKYRPKESAAANSVLTKHRSKRISAE